MKKLPQQNYFIKHWKWTEQASAWEIFNIRKKLFYIVLTLKKLKVWTKLWSKDEFLMTLMKLRLGLLFTDLSWRFSSVSITDMETIIGTTPDDIARNFKT